LAKKVNRMVEQIFVNDMKLAEDELFWRNKKAKLKQVKEDRAEDSGKGRLQRKRNMFQTMPINLKANFQRHLHRGHKYGVIAEAEPDNYQDKQIPLVHFIAVRAIEKGWIECKVREKEHYKAIAKAKVILAKVANGKWQDEPSILEKIRKKNEKHSEDARAKQPLRKRPSLMRQVTGNLFSALAGGGPKIKPAVSGPYDTAISSTSSSESATPREGLRPVTEPFESTELDATREPLSKENSETFAGRLSRRISESFSVQRPGECKQPSYYGRLTGQKKQSASNVDEGTSSTNRSHEAEKPHKSMADRYGSGTMAEEPSSPMSATMRNTRMLGNIKEAASYRNLERANNSQVSLNAAETELETSATTHTTTLSTATTAYKSGLYLHGPTSDAKPQDVSRI